MALTKEQYQIIADNVDIGLTDAVIAEKANCSAPTVGRYRAKANIARIYKRKLLDVVDNGLMDNTGPLKTYKNVTQTKQELTEKLKQYAGTAKDMKVAQLCNCSVSVVRNYRKQNNIPIYENSYSEKLTDTQIIRLRYLLQNTQHSDGEISFDVGCSRIFVKVCRQKLYRIQLRKDREKLTNA